MAEMVLEKLMAETRPYVAWEIIGDFMTEAFVRLGVPEEAVTLYGLLHKVIEGLGE